jgi:polyisoprenoid-binding protein YceI
MRNGLSIVVRTGSALLLGLCLATVPSAAPAGALAIGSARVTIAGTSNIHDYTASTTTVRVTRAQLGALPAGGDFLDHALKPGGVEAFEIAIPAATLTSAKDALDKNMHAALKASEHADITFRLVRFEPRPAPATGTRAIGVLRIAGVDRQVTIDIVTLRKDAVLTVKGSLALLMTDFGITPPKALMGALKTDPKVTITFEVALAANLT